VKPSHIDYRCSQCGRPSYYVRCAACRKPTAAERRRRAEFLEAWIATHGMMCVGFECDPHLTSKLEADHVVPLALGGLESSALQALCHRCNGRKNVRTRFGPPRSRRGTS
jgi:5-methylcytosine-specific restriction endonuclease McrA